MKQLISVLVLIALIQSVSAEDAYTFRQTYWGMSPQEVQDAETTPLLWDEELNLLSGAITVFNITTLLIYQFEDQQLDCATYLFSEWHEDLSLYIDDYNRVKQAFVVELGEAEYDFDLWSQDLYHDQKENWGLAVKIGHLTYIAYWETEKTDVSLSLTGENNEINFAALFQKVQ